MTVFLKIIILFCSLVPSFQYKWKGKQQDTNMQRSFPHKLLNRKFLMYSVRVHSWRRLESFEFVAASFVSLDFVLTRIVSAAEASERVSERQMFLSLSLSAPTDMSSFSASAGRCSGLRDTRHYQGVSQRCTAPGRDPTTQTHSHTHRLTHRLTHRHSLLYCFRPVLWLHLVFFAFIDFDMWLK